MKILFVHEVNYLAKVIFEVHEFPELLALAGHEVHFLHFPEGTGISDTSLRSRSRMIPGRVHPTAQINLITPPNIGGNFLDRLLAPITVVPKIRSLIRKGSFDVVVLYSVPTSGWQTVRIAKRAKVPVVFRALDVSHLIREGLTSRLVEFTEKVVYRNATVISANNPELGNYVSNLGNRSDVAIVNHPPLDLDHFALNDRNNVRARLGIEESAFVVTYMGSLFPFSGLLQVVSDFALISATSDRLMIIGGGEIENKLKNKVAELGIEAKVIFTGVIGYDDLPAYLSASDVLINPFESTLLTNLALPHKVLQYLATSTPIVSTRLAGLYGVLKEEAGINWVDEPSDVVAMCMRVKDQTDSVKSKKSEIGRKFVYANFNQAASLENLEATLALAISMK